MMMVSLQNSFLVFEKPAEKLLVFEVFLLILQKRVGVFKNCTSILIKEQKI